MRRTWILVAAWVLGSVVLAGPSAVAGPPEIAWFSATSTSGPAPFQVAFGSTLSCTQPSCRWSLDFGDGDVAHGSFDEWGGVAHLYTAPGTYYVQFTLYDDFGSDSKSLSITVTQPPSDVDPPTDGSGTIAVLGIALVIAFGVIAALLLVLMRTRRLPRSPPPPPSVPPASGWR
jgi:PKD repeat protein